MISYLLLYSYSKYDMLIQHNLYYIFIKYRCLYKFMYFCYCYYIDDVDVDDSNGLLLLVMFVLYVIVYNVHINIY